MDDNILAAFAKVINTDDDENNSMTGSLAFGSSELTIASGAVTATRSHHTIDTEADASSDDLDTITASSVSTGALLIIRAADAGRTVVVKHSTDNILMGDDADFTMDDADKRLVLQYDGTNWVEIARSPGVSPATQAEMEAASSTAVAVTPGRMKFSPHAVQAWATWDVTGALDQDLNVSSITDTGTGDWTMNFTGSFSAATYTGLATKEDVATFGGNDVAVSTKGTGSMRVVCLSGTSLNETNIVNVGAAVFGDL